MMKRVLAADDDASVREALGKLLTENGYEVSLAVNGDEAEARLASERVDLLLLDMDMPGRDGWDVVEAVSLRHPQLPVIVITGLAEQLDTKTIPGLDALLEKPVEVAVLLKKIEEVFAESAEARLRRLNRAIGAGAARRMECPGYLALPSSVGSGKP